MQSPTIDVGIWGWIWLIFFSLIVLALGVYGMLKTKTEEDFAVVRKSYRPWIVAFAFASTVASGSTFMGIPGLAYSKGFPAIWYPAVYPIGTYLGLLFSVALIKRAGDRFRSNSIPEFLGQRYNSDFLRVAFALLSLLLIYYVTAQVVAAATMFEVVLGVGYKGGILLTVGLVSLYITLGGCWSSQRRTGRTGQCPGMGQLLFQRRSDFRKCRTSGATVHSPFTICHESTHR